MADDCDCKVCADFRFTRSGRRGSRRRESLRAELLRTRLRVEQTFSELMKAASSGHHYDHLMYLKAQAIIAVEENIHAENEASDNDVEE